MFAVNGVCIEILKEVFGSTPITSMWTLAISFLGFSFGLTMIKKSMFENVLANFLGILFLILGSLLTPVQLAMMSHSWMSYLFIALTFLTSVLCGRSAVRFIYSERPERNSQRYGIFYFCSSLFVLLCLFFTETLGKDHVMIAVGILTLLFSYFEQKKERDRFFTYHLGFSGETFFMGTVSGLCLGLFLFISSWLFTSTGLEFLVFLFITWFAMGISPIVHKIFGFKPINYTLIGLCIFLGMLIAVLGTGFWDQSAGLYIDLAQVQKNLNLNATPSVFAVGTIFLIGLAFFIPLACIVPAFESKDSGRHYLYSYNIGHFAGFLFLSLLGFIWLYPLVIATFVIVAIIGLRDHGFAFVKKPLFFALIILIILIPPSLEEKALLQIQKSRAHCKDCEIVKFLGIEKSKGLLGFIGIDKGQNPVFGVNEARAPVYDLYDYQKAFVVQDFIKKEKMRILLLGLGNHALYQELTDHRIKNRLDYSVHVVEPLPHFENKNFRNSLAKMQGWKSDDPKDKIFYQRGLDFLLTRDSGSYDVVIWNFPQNLSSMEHSRWTLEFFKEIQRVQEVNGVFIAPNYNSSKLPCFINAAFKNTGSYPNEEKAPASVLIGTNKEKMGEAKIKSCQDYKIPRVSRFFFQRYRLMNRQKKALAEKAITNSELSQAQLDYSKARAFAQAVAKEKETLITVLPVQKDLLPKAEEFLYGLEKGFEKNDKWQVLSLSCNSLNVACAHKLLSFSRLNTTSTLLAPFGFSDDDSAKDFLAKNDKVKPFISIQPGNDETGVFQSRSLMSKGLKQALSRVYRAGKASTIKVVDLSNDSYKYWSRGEWAEKDLDPEAFLEVIDGDQLQKLRPGSINNIKRDSRFLYIKGSVKSRREFSRIRLYYDQIFFFAGQEMGLTDYCKKAEGFELEFKRRPDYFMDLGFQFARIQGRSANLALVGYSTRTMDLFPVNASSIEICEK